jgi:AmiR/NasT family two-component response regulator
MTGHGKTKFEEARAAGCDAFFCKPFDPVALNEVLRTLIFETEHSKILERLEPFRQRKRLVRLNRRGRRARQ